MPASNFQQPSAEPRRPHGNLLCSGLRQRVMRCSPYHQEYQRSDLFELPSNWFELAGFQPQFRQMGVWYLAQVPFELGTRGALRNAGFLGLASSMANSPFHPTFLPWNETRGAVPSTATSLKAANQPIRADRPSFQLLGKMSGNLKPPPSPQARH